ncbi:hypothetical protein [Parafrankia soli]|uniref:hypothetical protein n=1 Tax=Parafrankia soli TaxID=2599596 RepID=UPI0034D66B68
MSSASSATKAAEERGPEVRLLHELHPGAERSACHPLRDHRLFHRWHEAPDDPWHERGDQDDGQPSDRPSPGVPFRRRVFQARTREIQPDPERDERCRFDQDDGHDQLDGFPRRGLCRRHRDRHEGQRRQCDHNVDQAVAGHEFKVNKYDTEVHEEPRDHLSEIPPGALREGHQQIGDQICPVHIDAEDPVGHNVGNCYHLIDDPWKSQDGEHRDRYVRHDSQQGLRRLTGPQPLHDADHDAADKQKRGH